MDVIRFDNVKPRVWGVEFPQTISFCMEEGESLAILGENGSGKTMLCDIICGKSGIAGGKISYGFFDPENKPSGIRFASDMIAKMCFESAYNMADYSNMYYQQRFNALENDTTPTAGEILTERCKDKNLLESLRKRLGLDSLWEKHLIMLSSGELRRFLIAATLVKKPSLLIIDNPFIGLDKGMVAEMNDFFDDLKNDGWNLVFACPAIEEVPRCVTHIIPTKNNTYGEKRKKEEFFADKNAVSSIFPKRQYEYNELPETVLDAPSYDVVLEMNDINISYPTRTLFKNLNWTIRKGEKWSLSGPNGTGKSTLLSLVVADNPKAYAQNIILFDRKRGTGESIWDIKKHIGYISSEMHLFFLEDQSCLKIVASGFFDTIGLFRKASEEQLELAKKWMSLFGIERLADRSFIKISGGEQRLVLLCRTLVKNPDLLILDEPLHGLDIENKLRARDIINKYAQQKDKTMIYVTHRAAEIPEVVSMHKEL